jgi:hypothetical protein
MDAIGTAAFLLIATLLATTPSLAETNHPGGSWAPEVTDTPSFAMNPTFLDRGAIREPAGKRVRPRHVKLSPKAMLRSRVGAKPTKVRAVVGQRHALRTRVTRAVSSRPKLRSFDPVTTGGIQAGKARAHMREHRIVIQVTQNDPALMNVALNNAQNLLKHYEAADEKVQIEFVAYGPGRRSCFQDAATRWQTKANKRTRRSPYFLKRA